MYLPSGENVANSSLNFVLTSGNRLPVAVDRQRQDVPPVASSLARLVYRMYRPSRDQSETYFSSGDDEQRLGLSGPGRVLDVQVARPLRARREDDAPPVRRPLRVDARRRLEGEARRRRRGRRSRIQRSPRPPLSIDVVGEALAVGRERGVRGIRRCASIDRRLFAAAIEPHQTRARSSPARNTSSPLRDTEKDARPDVVDAQAFAERHGLTFERERVAVELLRDERALADEEQVARARRTCTREVVLKSGLASFESSVAHHQHLVLRVLADDHVEEALAVGQELRPPDAKRAGLLVRRRPRSGRRRRWRALARSDRCRARRRESRLRDSSEPSAPFGASQIVCGGPPAMSTFFSLPPAKNARNRLSGDQNGRSTPSVPGSGRASSDIERADPDQPLAVAVGGKRDLPAVG